MLKNFVAGLSVALMSAALIPSPASAVDTPPDCTDSTQAGTVCTMPTTPVCATTIRDTYETALWKIVQLDDHWFRVAKERKQKIERLRAEIRRLRARG